MDTTIAPGAGGVVASVAQKTVVIELREVDGSYEGQLALFMLVNQLIRLDEFCPQIVLALPRVPKHPLLRLLPDGSFDEAVLDFMRPFPYADRVTVNAGAATPVSDVVVRVSPDQTGAGMNVWGQGWIAYLNAAPSAPLEPGPPNPVGPTVASAFGAAEIFKRLLGEQPMRPGLKVLPLESLTFSAFDYSLTDAANPVLASAIDVDGVVVVGLGGIGAGLTAAMASLEAMVGTLWLVDRDEIDITSHNRHLVSRPGDSGYKVDLARRGLSFHSDLQPKRMWFEEFVQAHGDDHRLVVVGVDHDRVRREIQGSLPRVILNGGTSDDASLRVTRHDFLRGACLSCISRDDLREHPMERQLARQLGMALDDVLGYWRSGEAVPAEALRQGGILTEQQIEQLAGQPMPEIQVRVCAELQLGAGVDEPAVSISFLSALPGFLLLGELIKEAQFATGRPPLNRDTNHAFLSLLGRPHPALLRGRFEKRPDCDCSRAPYVRAYERKWS